MHGWETRMLLKYYLERGISKAELSRRFGVSRRTIHEWVETGQLDRDLSSGGSRYAPRPPAPHKLDPLRWPNSRHSLSDVPGTIQRVTSRKPRFTRCEAERRRMVRKSGRG